LRTKQIKVNNQSVEALLIAGGKGFTIYTAKGVNGWIVSIQRNILTFDENHPHFETVAKYVTIKYQPIKKHNSIQKNFDKLISKLTKNLEKEALSL
jgi:allophanate hydrolase subunit 1